MIFLPGLSPSRLSMFLRRVLVLVGSSGACWMEPNVAFFPFFPSSFSTSEKINRGLANRLMHVLTGLQTPLTVGDAGLLEHGLKGLVCFSKRWTFCRVPPPT